MVRVRFHLGKGEHYQHWQVRWPDGRREYHKPDEVSLIMFGCRLRNHRRTAQRIHAGEHKKVCAWVEAEQVHVCEPIARFWPGLDGRGIAFNPRVAPHWADEAGRDIDGSRYEAVLSSGRRLAVGKESCFYSVSN
jgi:hypothetical protein